MRPLSRIIGAHLERKESEWLHRREEEKRARIVKSMRLRDADTELVLMVMRRDPERTWSPSRIVFAAMTSPQIRVASRVWQDVMPAVVASGLHELGMRSLIRLARNGEWKLNERSE